MKSAWRQALGTRDVGPRATAIPAARATRHTRYARALDARMNLERRLPLFGG